MPNQTRHAIDTARLKMPPSAMRWNLWQGGCGEKLSDEGASAAYGPLPEHNPLQSPAGSASSCNESERTINVTRTNITDLDNLGTIINDFSLLLCAILPILEFPFCSKVEDSDASLSDCRKSLEVGSL